MKRFILFAATLVIAAFFTASAEAQAIQTPVGKVALVDTRAFTDEKTGINKFTTAMKNVYTEFKRELDDLSAMVTRLEALDKEVENLRNQISAAQRNPQLPIPTTLQTSFSLKSDELEKGVREHKFKQEDLRARFERRRDLILDPIKLEIRKALAEYTKQKGYAMLLDGAKLDEAQILLGLDQSFDVTADFIKYFNARPATAAKTTTTTPPPAANVPAKPTSVPAKP